MATAEAVTGPFVMMPRHGKFDAATRKLIRSQAMRGRKQWGTRLCRNALVHGYDMPTGSVEAPSVDLKDILRMYKSPVCHGGTDPASGTLSVLSNITRVSPIAQRVVYPLLIAVGHQVDNHYWLKLCAEDTAALHITAFSVESFTDLFLRQRQIAPAAMLHLQKELCLFRHRLASSDEQLKISDASIGVVLKLATSAHFTGDVYGENQHMVGVRKMVDLRGGVGEFDGNPLLFEVLRCDLVHALSNNFETVFYRRDLEPIPAYPMHLLPEFKGASQAEDLVEVNDLLDNSLIEVWEVMRRFALIIGLSAQTQRLISTKIINETMVSVLYRLLQMCYPTNSLQRSIQLTLLAYGHHCFLQWRDIKLPGHPYRRAFRQGIQAMQQGDKASSRLMLWMLMVVSVSFFDVQGEEWLYDALRHHARDYRSWNKVQDILKSFLWIPLLDQEQGRSIWTSLE